MLIQRTCLQLGNKTTLLFSSDGRRLLLSLIWIKDYGIGGTHTISVHWRKRLRGFYTDLLSVKILRRTITVLWRRNVLNKIILISRGVHLLLVLNQRAVYILLFLTRNIDFMSSTVHW